MDGAGNAGDPRAERTRRTGEADLADKRFEDAIATLASEIAELRRNFGQLIEQVGRVGEAGGESARAAVRAAGSEGIGVTEKAQAELAGEFRALRDEVGRTARDHPWRTIGLAAVAGLVMGLVMRR